jgi:hypothetical protein
MKPKISPSLKLFLIIVLCLIACVQNFVFTNAPTARAQITSWSSPVVISAGAGYSWFPDLAVDETGIPHVVWCQTNPEEQNDILSLVEQVYYTKHTDNNWLKPNDIIPPSNDIIRNAIVSDMGGNILLLFGGSVLGRNFTLYFSKADQKAAWSAQSWSLPVMLNRGASYMGDIAVDSQGRIHVIYDDMIRYSGKDTNVFSDIYYRQTTDYGQNWSENINLYSEPETGSARPYMEIDSNDIIHVTWDEGWDRLTGADTGEYHSVYVNSQDNGITWSAPTIIDYPGQTAVQLTVGSNGQGGVMLVWRSHSIRSNLFYQWSSDNGSTWGEPEVISHIFARPWGNNYDMYDMATDSAGNIHLLVTAQEKEDINATIGVYHLIWDGKKWSLPEKVFSQENLYPEYPKIVIYAGNQIHAVWFTREGSIWDQTVPRVIWYSRSKADAPAAIITPPPSRPTIPIPTATQIPYPSETPRPTISAVGIDTTSPTNEKGYLEILAVVLAPVVFLLGVVLIGKYLNNQK